jgi:hypothetical protein
MEKYGVENLKIVWDLGESLGTAYKGAKADGKIGLEDLGQFMVIAPKIQPAMAAIKLVDEEIKDLDSEEMQEITEYVSAGLGRIIDKEELLRKINKGAKALFAIGDFALEFTGKDESDTSEA